MKRLVLLMALMTLCTACAFGQGQNFPGGGAGGTFGPNYATGGGVAQAQTVAPTGAVTNVTLVNGYQVCWLPVAANTAAAPTLAGGGTSTFTAKSITKVGSGGLTALIANDIVTTAIACAIYDGTEFQLQNPQAGIVVSGSVSIGSGASAAGATATGGFAAVEAASTGWTPTAGQDYCRADSTLHTFVCAVNGVAEAPEILGTCATANALSIFTAASTAGCGLADFTYASHTLTGGAAGLINLSAAGAGGLTIPGESCTSGPNGDIGVVNSDLGEMCFRYGGYSNKLAIAGTSSSATVCTNQFLSAISSQPGTPPTCTSLTPAFLPGNASTTPVTASNPTINTDTNLIVLSPSAGYFNVASNSYEVRAAGNYTTTAASSPALTFRVKLCTVTGCGSGTAVTLASFVTTALSATALTNATWTLAMDCVTNATGATGNLVCKGMPGLTLDTGATLITPDSTFVDANTATSSNIDLTAALFVQVTVAQSVVGASNSYVQTLAKLR